MFKDAATRISGNYQRLIEYFISPEMAANQSKANQARMFLISHTMGPVLGNSVPLALYLFDPTPGFDALILAMSITAFWIFPFLLRKNWNYDLLVFSSVLNLNFAILWSCYHYGGVASPTLPWLMIIPILSLFYIGGEKRLQLPLLGMSATSFAIFLAVYHFYGPTPNDLPSIAIQGLGIVSTVAALCYVATMAIYYSRVFDAGVQLEKEVRRRMKTTEDLREAVSAADRAASIKADFLAGMSHELRTPLNAVIGYSDMLKEDLEDDGEVQMGTDVDRIQDAAHYLLRLINMILDLSKIEAGHMRFEIRDNDLSLALEEVVASKREIAETNGSVLSLKVAPAVSRFNFDEGRLRQIVSEVVENACSHTQNGIISVHADQLVKAAGNKILRIAVKDNGEGISKDQLDTIFESLYGAREASSGRYGGTGLSLHVVQRLAQAMQGRVYVDSEAGKGTTFTFEFPEQIADEKPVEPEPVQNVEVAEAIAA